MASTENNTEVLSNPPAIACSSSSFSEHRPLSPELTTNNMFRNQSKMEPNPLHYNQMNPFDSSTSTTISDQNALNAFEHDHAFLSKRTHTRGSRRTSSRLQARAVGSIKSGNPSTKSKRTRNVNRATDIETSDDLSYYLERRRKNNEASKMSRAARKQKFGSMDQQW
jgi:hypothetical protein